MLAAITDGAVRLIVGFPALLYVLVLAGEEIPDLLQQLAGDHPDTDPVLRSVNHYHRQEEARHLAFARTKLPEVWAKAGPVDRFAVRHIAPIVIQSMFDLIVHPGVYATVGLPRWKTWWRVTRSANRIELRHRVTRPVFDALLAAGAVSRDAVPRGWRSLCGLVGAARWSRSSRSGGAPRRSAPRRPDPKRAARREQLIEAALAAIRRDGPGVSMQAIAVEAGVSKPILYRHFGDRGGLVAELATRFTQELMARLRHALSQHSEPRLVLAATIDAYVEAIEQDPNVYQFLVNRALVEDQQAGQHLLDLIEQISREVAVVLGEQLRAAVPTPAPPSRGRTGSSVWCTRPATGG